MKRTLKVVVVGIAGFLATFGGIFFYWRSGYDPNECTGECLEGVAVVIWGFNIGILVGVACAFVAYVLTGRRGNGS